MLRTAIRSTLALVALASAAQAQTVTGPTAGFAFNSATQSFVDPSFQYAFSFRARGFGGNTAGDILGAQGTGSPDGTPCVVGETCQSSSGGAGYSGGTNRSYFFNLDLTGASGAPALTISTDGFGDAELALQSVGGTGFNTFFVQLAGGAGALTISELSLNGQSLQGASISTTGSPLFYRIDLPTPITAGYLQGRITTGSTLSTSMEGQRVEIYAGSASVVPEPSTYVLMASGLAGLGMVARRRAQG